MKFHLGQKVKIIHEPCSDVHIIGAIGVVAGFPHPGSYTLTLAGLPDVYSMFCYSEHWLKNATEYDNEEEL